MEIPHSLIPMSADDFTEKLLEFLWTAQDESETNAVRPFPDLFHPDFRV